MFDYIECLYSKHTMSVTRWRPTKTYRTPPTSWGIECREIQPLFSRWLGKTVLVHNSVYRLPAVLRGDSYLLLRSICRFSPTFFPVGICLVDYRNAAKLCVFLSFTLTIQGGQYCNISRARLDTFYRIRSCIHLTDCMSYRGFVSSNSSEQSVHNQSGQAV